MCGSLFHWAIMSPPLNTSVSIQANDNTQEIIHGMFVIAGGKPQHIYAPAHELADETAEAQNVAKHLMKTNNTCNEVFRTNEHALHVRSWLSIIAISLLPVASGCP